MGDNGMRFAAMAIVKNAFDMTYSRYEVVNGFANLNSLFRKNYAVRELLSHYFWSADHRCCCLPSVVCANTLTELSLAARTSDHSPTSLLVREPWLEIAL